MAPSGGDKQAMELGHTCCQKVLCGLRAMLTAGSVPAANPSQSTSQIMSIAHDRLHMIPPTSWLTEQRGVDSPQLGRLSAFTCPRAAQTECYAIKVNVLNSSEPSGSACYAQFLVSPSMAPRPGSISSRQQETDGTKNTASQGNDCKARPLQRQALRPAPSLLPPGRGMARPMPGPGKRPHKRPG